MSENRHIRSISNFSDGSKGGGGSGFSRGGNPQHQGQRGFSSLSSGFDGGGFSMPISPPLQFHDIKIVNVSPRFFS